MRQAAIALLFMVAAHSSRAADASDSNSRPATSNEVSQIQDYTRTLSKEWLKDYLAIDLDAIGLRIRKRVWQSYSAPSAPVTAASVALAVSDDVAPGEFASLQSMDFGLENYDDLRRMQQDLRDIPLAVRFDADSFFFNRTLKLHTSFFVPLSWKDELRAEARLPLPSLAPEWIENLLSSGGFSAAWDLKSSYGNRLGVSSVQTGLGTQWMSIWSLNYEFRVRYGQDIYEESQWLRLGRQF